MVIVHVYVIVRLALCYKCFVLLLILRFNFGYCTCVCYCLYLAPWALWWICVLYKFKLLIVWLSIRCLNISGFLTPPFSSFPKQMLNTALVRTAVYAWRVPQTSIVSTVSAHMDSMVFSALTVRFYFKSSNHTMEPFKTWSPEAQICARLGLAQSCNLANQD